MAKNKGGRPRIDINWTDFDKLCTLQCTQIEIANWFDCSVDTIERACLREHKIGFAEYYAQKRGKGRISLRRKQWEVAHSGNVSMLIWLGKQYLGQADQVFVDQSAEEKYERPDSMKAE